MHEEMELGKWGCWEVIQHPGWDPRSLVASLGHGESLWFAGGGGVPMSWRERERDVKAELAEVSRGLLRGAAWACAREH